MSRVNINVSSSKISWSSLIVPHLMGHETFIQGLPHHLQEQQAVYCYKHVQLDAAPVDNSAVSSLLGRFIGAGLDSSSI